MKRILLVDNYDSFTYNLAHYLEAINCVVDTRFNDQLDMDSIAEYDAIVFSPGPGLPADAGFMPEIINRYLGKVPMLGVCLGMQALAEKLEGSLYNQKQVKHGVQESIELIPVSLFEGLGTQMEVGLYHSWAVSAEGDYDVIASSREGVVMALQNEKLKCVGVQFHPESIMTPNGKLLLENFIRKYTDNQAIATK